MSDDRNNQNAMDEKPNNQGSSGASFAPSAGSVRTETMNAIVAYHLIEAAKQLLGAPSQRERMAELAEECVQIMYQIERCGASVELTRALCMVGDLQAKLKALALNDKSSHTAGRKE